MDSGPAGQRDLGGRPRGPPRSVDGPADRAGPSSEPFGSVFRVILRRTGVSFPDWAWSKVTYPRPPGGGGIHQEDAVKVILRVVCLVAVGIVLSGCANSGTTPTAPSQPATTTTTTTQTGSGSGVATLADPDAKLFAVTPADSPSGQPPCQFNPATGEFECPSQTRDGITFTRQFTLYDARGNVLPRFGRDVAAIRTETTADGTTTRDGGAVATIHRAGEMMTTGLGPDAKAHTLNGREHGTITTTMTAPDGTKVTANATIDGVTVNLVVPVRPGDRTQAYPLSGTRIHTTTTIAPGKGPLTLRRQETFDGTNIVKVELTVNGVTQSCTFDLATKTSTCRQNP